MLTCCGPGADKESQVSPARQQPGLSDLVSKPQKPRGDHGSGSYEEYAGSPDMGRTTSGEAESYTMHTALTFLESSGLSGVLSGALSTQESDLRTVWRHLSLNMDLRYDGILRATDVPAILAGMGSHFRSRTLASKTFTEEEANAMFEESWAVTEFADFMSHSWRDTRMEKVVSLCIHYNGKPAVLVSLLAAFGMFSLNVLNKTPKLHNMVEQQEELAPWSLVVGNLVLVLATLSWHHLPSWLGGSRGRPVFFDKLCVHQFNSELKRSGIRSFAAFIARSQNMLLLWSPDYFKRLWCVLELAAMVRCVQCQQDEDSEEPEPPLPLIFLPVRLAVFAVMMNAVMAFCLLPITILDGLGMFDQQHVENRAMLPFLLIAIGMLPSCHFMRRYMKVRHVLTRQLAHFAVESAECHVEADRPVILESIRLWFGSLEAFNDHVRATVSAQVRRSLGRETHIPATILVYCVLPLVFCMLDYAPTSQGATVPLKVVSRLTELMAVLSTLSLMMHLSGCALKRISVAWKDVLVSTFIGLVLAFVLIGEVVLVSLLLRLENIWASLAALVVFLVWFLLLGCVGGARYNACDTCKGLRSRSCSRSGSSLAGCPVAQ